jgi:hypothetical protein
MALIIELNRDVEYEPEIKNAQPPAEQKAAEVILFPGVRYERWLDEQTGGSQTAATSAETDTITVSRDWLKI